MGLYLGFDSSTQSLTATLLEVSDGRREVLFTRSFRFDDVLPQYGTRHGVLPSGSPGVVHAPPLMWADALETMFAELMHEQVAWHRLRAISGSAQQHGSVFLSARAADRLSGLDPAQPLARQLEDVLARTTSPVWMDSSTSEQCRAIEAALGGSASVARLTGSRAFERFTGPQIRKFAEQDPHGYARTDRIHLVSSWLASLLAGRHAAIDYGDGSGMNLMDLETRTWSVDALRATAADLDAKLPPLAPSWTVAGTLAPYWTTRFGLPPARVIIWSGDNPCSLIGTGLVDEGHVAISLGTSDTIFGLMRQARVSDEGTGHVFASPTGEFMGMTVFRNGSLARERIRDEYGLDWAGFSAALRGTPPGNHGATMFPWFEPEITPLVLNPGVRRYALDPSDAGAAVRAVIEAQMMAMARHSRWMGVTIGTIRATGGAAANRDILQVLADVFDAEVSQLPAGNSAALGAALRAFHADRAADGQSIAWDDVVSGFTAPLAGSSVQPVPAHVATYRGLSELYAERERDALARTTPASA